MELTNTILELKIVEPLVCVTKYNLKNKKNTFLISEETNNIK